MTRNKQITDGVTYGDDTKPMTYAYNLGGALVEQAYPSGRVVKNTFDENGDLAQMQSKKDSNSGFFTYADAFSYNSAGALTKMQLGNGKWETFSYNSRQQITQIGLGTTDTTQNLLKLEFSYGTSTQNNGSMLEQKITVPTVGSNSAFTAIQTYTYDSLNRIQSATETVNSSQTWKQTFTIDRYGNRRYDAANTTTNGSWATAVRNPNINTSDNRFTAGQGYLYDENGNVKQDATSQRFTYDAENHQQEFFAASNPGSTPDATYHYDGDGKRVKKVSQTETTVFVHDAGASVIAEYSTALAAVQQVSYLTTDHLGSPRITTNENGAVTNRKDFTAYGEEVISAQRVSGTSGNGYQPSSPTREDYTGYEKDLESGLEFAQARYYSPTHGRFTSVDPLTASASIRDPQTLNRYSYVLNSPYKFTDPLGLLPSTGIACGMCGNESFYVDGSAFRGRDASFDWAKPAAEPPAPPPPPAGQDDKPHEPRSKIASKEDIQIDNDLSDLLTDTGFVMGASSSRSDPPVPGGPRTDNHYELADRKLHTIHIYANQNADSADAGVFIPKRFSEVKITSRDTVVARDPRSGDVILIAHVAVGSGRSGQNTLRKNMETVRENGTTYIGQIGGKGGTASPSDGRGIHSHLSYFTSEKGRLNAHVYKQKNSGYTTAVAKDLGNFRRLVR